MADTKRFYVINRGSGSEGSEDEGAKQKIPSFRRRLPDPPTKPLPKPAISTNVAGPRQPSSLSSPSPTNTNSPANEESTPPPTTPGLDIEPLTDVYTPTRHMYGFVPSTMRPEISPTEDRTLILVTGDSERYVNVDITAAKSPAAIRECVFSKLNIFDDADQSRFSIYQTEIGTSAISGALSDERLFELCRNLGDAKGSLKLLVMESQHSPSHSISTTQSTTFAPLRPAPRSRQDSLSSAASEQTPEVSAGYEADLDNPTVHHLTPSSLPSNGIPRRSHTPPPLPTPPVTSTLIDKFGNLVQKPPPPPPLSPDRPSFTDTNLTPPVDRPNHVRSASDAAEERRVSSGQGLLQSSSRSKSDKERRQRRRHDTDERSDSWVLVTRDSSRSGDQDTSQQDSPRKSPLSARSTRPQMSPGRYHKPSYGRSIQIPAAPRNPPPAVPTTSPAELRSPPRHSGQPVPSNWTVTWKGEEKGEQRSRLAKGTKSMDNLHHSYKHTSRNPPPPLPTTPSNGTILAYIRDLSSAGGITKSRPHVRPLPMHGSLTPSTFDVSPSHYRPYHTPTTDPYPRPTSALGESATQTIQRHPRQAQSPTYGNTLELPDARSPRATSSNQQIFPPRSAHSYSDRRGESSYTLTDLNSPPRSPVGSPRSPRPTIQDTSHDSEATLTHEDHGWLLKVIERSDGTVVPSRMDGSSRSATRSVINDSDSDKDGSGTSIWQKPPVERPKSALRGPALTVQIESPGGVHPVSIPSSGSSGVSTSTATPVPTRRTHSPSGSGSNTVTPLNVKQRPRRSTFTERDSSWAPRPPPEDVYERLEEFFPEHDLDKPLIEAGSGGTSPTAVDPPVVPLPLPSKEDKSRMKGKKSIRHVAEEHKKRIDRTSRADFSSTMLRKRSTKLWGSKLEEVNTMQTKGMNVLPDSPSGGPTTFKWVRGELIGRGTYGRVYLALNATTGEMIAVKQVEIPRTASDKNDSRHTTVVQALKMESETLKDLDHPNIVTYLGFEETPDNLSIFLEYVPGGSIGSCLLKHGKFDEEVTKSFTFQILDGLEYLHSKGILHRDLKADNILVETTGTCKISDFGISKRTEDSAGAATAMQGTVFWMAPEVVNPQGKSYNNKVDIWSVGCVVLEMWAGMRPWQGDELVAVMFKLYTLRQPPPVPDSVDLSPLADDFRQKCFAINPDERPSASELRKHKYLEPTPGWTFKGFK